MKESEREKLETLVTLSWKEKEERERGDKQARKSRMK